MMDILIHLYHHDLWEEINRYILACKLPFRLFINLTDNQNPKLITNKILHHHPTAKIIISPNQGRDIGGYLCLLETWMQEKDYGDILFLGHTKKSCAAWRFNLFNNILSKSILINNLFLDENIGMIGHAPYVLPNYSYLGYMGTETEITRYGQEFNLNTENFLFVAGTIFCVRASIFREFFNKYSPIKIASELKSPHTIERIFGIIAGQHHKVISVYDNTIFDEQFYLQNNLDVKDAIKHHAWVCSYYHFITNGIKERRKPFQENTAINFALQSAIKQHKKHRYFA